ncbi:hypothetical protein NQ318_011823 [Aromia moschata]|uniref:DUF4817 domain-containing protein n=1 Tax=Aromia moschata TaxID=1265417 RepID=A0AAV8XR30_9CUCU|nr:hypothetical protein NQ318_011823 [Aromia moschata]
MPLVSPKLIIGYGDRTRTQAEVVRLFQEKYPELPPIYQGTVNKIEKQFRERGHVRQLKKNPPNKLSDDQKLDIFSNGNSSVPSVDYIVNGVELLKKAYSVYPNMEDVAALYLELYQQTYQNFTWNLVAGYNFFKINSDFYIPLYKEQIQYVKCVA